MFTGIIEATGRVVNLQREGQNLHMQIASAISDELTVDQSVAHNGVCLTVTQTEKGIHYVTAIFETLQKSNLGSVRVGSVINLERCMKIGDRLDGHIVQGHVDTTAILSEIEDQKGSFLLTFSIDPEISKYIINKGSISVNGVSLTVVTAGNDHFSVAIIPYTWEHTNFNRLKTGERVNIELDVIGKYVERMMNMR